MWLQATSLLALVALVSEIWHGQSLPCQAFISAELMFWKTLLFHWTWAWPLCLYCYEFWVQTNRRMFMGATPSQVLVLGLNRSTEFRQLVPSFPPATYSMPSSTATPALLRRLSMLAIAVHVLLCSLNQETEHWSHVHRFIHSVWFCLHIQLSYFDDKRAYSLPGGHISPLLRDVRSCHNLPLHTSCHLEGKRE